MPLKTERTAEEAKGEGKEQSNDDEEAKKKQKTEANNNEVEKQENPWTKKEAHANTKSGRVVPWPLTLEKAAALKDVVSVGQRGLTCKQFQETVRFVKRLCRTGLLKYTSGKREGQRILWTEITMLEVCDNVVMPVIDFLRNGEKKYSCAWSTLVSEGCVQQPQIFISHSFEEKFKDFVATFENLKEDRGLKANDVVWICTFANNQFDRDFLKAPLIESPFYGALIHAKEVALFLDHKASALSRSWCNFELAITTDTPQNRKRWNIRKMIAEQRRCDLFQIDWSEVEVRMLQESVASGGTSAPLQEHDLDRERQLLLCTPSGMVGTQRVRSGPILKALSTHDSSKAGASKKIDRQRIKDYISDEYLVEKPKKNDAPKNEDKNGNSEMKVSQFKMLDDTIFMECSKALERKGLQPEALMTREKRGRNMLKKLSTESFKKNESGLTLAQLRDLEVLLKDQCEKSVMVVDGKKLEWEKCTTRHLFPSKGQKHAGDNEWDGLAASFMPPSKIVDSTKVPAPTYAECVNKHKQKPEFYVIVPWDMLLVDVFSAIEWHAEALCLSDRSTYYIHGLCLLNPESRHDADFNRVNFGPLECEDVMHDTSEGVLMLVGEDLEKCWKENGPSLWCLYELWLADQYYELPWDVACCTGICATSRPFVNKKWECGTFNPKIAKTFAETTFQAEDAFAVERDKAMLLRRIEEEGGITKFNESVTSRFSMCMLGPFMRHSAYMDDGEESLKALWLALKLLKKYRCKYTVNLSTFQGSLGETPLHILAARRELEKCIDGHTIMQALVKAGFDVNDQDDEGETPLHWAAFAGAERTTRFLVRHEANPMKESFNREDPLQIAQAKPSLFLPGEFSENLETILRKE
jgi:hypothetical protein